MSRRAIRRKRKTLHDDPSDHDSMLSWLGGSVGGRK